MRKRSTTNLLLLSSFAFIYITHLAGSHHNSNNWNGTVSFSSTLKGPDIALSEWKMEGTFRNGEGTVQHSSKYQSFDGQVKKNCSVTSTGRLVIDIDEASGKYTIMVCGVKDCVGTLIDHGVNSTYTVPGGDTAIIIDRQPMRGNRDSLVGSISHRFGPQGRGLVQTQVFKWSLVKGQE